jgi:hypothetical protein
MAVSSRGIQAPADGEGHAFVFAMVEDVRLIGRRLQAGMGDAMPLGQTRCTVLDELENSGGGGDIPFAKFIVDHHARFGQMADHGHVALLALVGDAGGFLLGDDLGGVRIEGVFGDSGLPDPCGDDALVESGKTCPACPAPLRRSQSPTASVEGQVCCLSERKHRLCRRSRRPAFFRHPIGQCLDNRNPPGSQAWRGFCSLQCFLNRGIWGVLSALTVSASRAAMSALT